MKGAYSYKPVPRGFMRQPMYMIMFEDVCIRQCQGISEADVQDMVWLFNAAYDQGFSQGYRSAVSDAAIV